MATKTLRGKCPRCCPDGGACFTREYDHDENGNWSWVKKCNNCFLVLPIRKVVASGKPSKSQQRVLDKITNWGWIIKEQRLIGRKLWVTAEHPTKSWVLGNQLCGTLGVSGSFKINLYRLGGDRPLTDDIDLEVYLK